MVREFIENIVLTWLTQRPTRCMLRRSGIIPNRPRNFSLKKCDPLSLFDDMSVTHAQKLDITIAPPLSMSVKSFSRGDIVPPGYFLGYLNHYFNEYDLGADGYDNSQAPSGYPIRRWLGGTVEFSTTTPFILGKPAQCVERISQIKQRNKHAIVSIVRELGSIGQAWSVREQRSLLYLKENSELLKTQLKKHRKAEFKPDFSQDLRISQLLILRYSSLTFNCHRIHFDSSYASKEHLPSTIAQGPLMVTLLLRWFSGCILKGSSRSIQNFEYRNVAPLFVEQIATLCATRVTQDLYQMWIQNDKGDVVLTGELTVF